jgi:hypothetical protein
MNPGLAGRLEPRISLRVLAGAWKDTQKFPRPQFLLTNGVLVDSAPKTLRNPAIGADILHSDPELQSFGKCSIDL